MWAKRIATLSQGGFSLAAFMASQSDGFWYDFGQTDRLFQENTGATPADDPNEVIGLALSSRLWSGRTLAQQAASQPEVVSNGGFDTGDAWSTGAGLSIGSGRAIWSNSSAGLSQGAALLLPGRTYAFTVVIASISQGSLRFNSGGAGYTGVTRTAPGTYTEYLTPTTGGIISFGALAAATAEVDSISVKEVSRYPATQATGSFKPTFQTTGAKFDGTDDNLLTGYTPGAAANFVVARVTVPATLAATQGFFGASNGVADRFWMAFTPGGLLQIGLGSNSLIFGTTDLRGQTATVGLAFNGTQYRVFVGSALEAAGSQAGAPHPTIPVRIGANNNAGTAVSFFAGSVRSIVGGREFIDLARFNQIAAALMAA